MKINVKKLSVLLAFVLAVTCLASCSSDGKDVDKKADVKTEEEVKVSKESKKKINKAEKEIKELEDKMSEELKEATTEEEKQAIKEKYEQKIEEQESIIETAKPNVTPPNEENIKKPESKPDNDKKPNDGKKPDEGKKPSKPEVKPQPKPNKPEVKPVPKPDVNVKPVPTPDKPKEPEKKKVWVVDQKAQDAWDETVTDYENPIEKERFIIYFRPGTNPPHGIDGISEKGSPYKIYEDKALFNMTVRRNASIVSSYAGYDLQVTYPTKTIHHPAVPEKGHWEWR